MSMENLIDDDYDRISKEIAKCFFSEYESGFKL